MGWTLNKGTPPNLQDILPILSTHCTDTHCGGKGLIPEEPEVPQKRTNFYNSIPNKCNSNQKIF